MNMMIVTKFLRSCCPPVTVDEIRRTPVAEAPIGQGPVARALDSSAGLLEATAGSYLRAVAACAQARGRHHMSPISPLMEADA